MGFEVPIHLPAPAFHRIDHTSLGAAKRTRGAPESKPSKVVRNPSTPGPPRSTRIQDSGPISQKNLETQNQAIREKPQTCCL